MTPIRRQGTVAASPSTTTVLIATEPLRLTGFVISSASVADRLVSVLHYVTDDDGTTTNAPLLMGATVPTTDALEYAPDGDYFLLIGDEIRLQADASGLYYHFFFTTLR